LAGVQSATIGQVRVQVAGDASLVKPSAAARVEAVSDVKSAEVALQLPGKDAVSTSFSTGASVIDLAISLGMPADAAQRTFGTLAAHAAARGGPLGISAQARAVTSHVAVARRMSAVGASSVGTPWTQYCASVDGGSGTRVHSYGCVVRYKDQVKGDDWWIGDEGGGSGWSTNNDRFNPDRLTGLRLHVSMPTGNVLAKWDPRSSYTPPDSCTDETVAVTSPETGTTYSQKETVCSDQVDPYLTSDHLNMGETWQGLEPSSNWYEGVEFADVWHTPAGANPNGNAYIWMQWT
jgi:hypothetical protein